MTNSSWRIPLCFALFIIGIVIAALIDPGTLRHTRIKYKTLYNITFQNGDRMRYYASACEWYNKSSGCIQCDDRFFVGARAFDLIPGDTLFYKP